MRTSEIPTPLKHLIVCPTCYHELEFGDLVMNCVACGSQFVQSDDACVSLQPNVDASSEANEWEMHQQCMEQWYLDILQYSWAGEALARDYAPYAAWLSQRNGTILDVGGGAGLVREFLPSDATYINIEPSPMWQRPEWNRVQKQFNCVASPQLLVRGVAEHLPFRATQFDTVLSFWSLNHASRPETAVKEIIRVLKPSGRFLVVLEDMEPSWLDLMRNAIGRIKLRHVAQFSAEKIRCLLERRSWPIADDHCRILEDELMRWVGRDLLIIRRTWNGRYLVYEFQQSSR